eukprot:gene32969-42663_t
MLNIIRIVAFLILVYAPSLSFLNNGHRSIKSVTFQNKLKISDTEDLVITSSTEFENNSLFAQQRNPTTANAEETTLGLNPAEEIKKNRRSQFFETSMFLLRAAVVGAATGGTVVVFKTAILAASVFFYENLANLLPRPVFYWPMALYPLMGSVVVSCLLFLRGPSLRNGIDSIAQSIDSKDAFVLPFPLPAEALADAALNSPQAFVPTPFPTSSSSSLSSTATSVAAFDPVNQLCRLGAAVATLGSGCSLGPEGPSVEIGAGISRMASGGAATLREKHHLFLAGTAAGVSAGFNAPIAGVFFAIECGNRYLSKNTIRLDEDSPDGPRADIAAIVLAAALANLICNIGLQKADSLTITGNEYAMVSPLVELPLYMGLGLVSGAIAVAFTKLRDVFAGLFRSPPLSEVPEHLHPLFGGLLCGAVAVFYPQTLFVGYFILDQLLAGKLTLAMPLLLQLLGLKLLLSSFSLGSGLTGGVFAPALFFGAVAGTAYHDTVSGLVDAVQSMAAAAMVATASASPLSPSLPLWDGDGAALDPSEMVRTLSSSGEAGMLWNSVHQVMLTLQQTDMSQFFSIAGAPAYATVGAAATLGALFRAPLTSSMLMFELTQNHDIVLPVLVSTGLGGLFAELLSQPRRLW